MERCFADIDTHVCSALTKKKCKGCIFRKPLSQAIESVHGYVPYERYMITEAQLLREWGVSEKYIKENVKEGETI